MSGAGAQNQVDMAMSHEPKISTPMYEINEKAALEARHSVDSRAPVVEFEADLVGEEPTEEELRTLPRVSGQIPWLAYTFAFVELSERFSYYGCTAVCKYYE